MTMEKFAFGFETGHALPEAKLELAADILNSIVNLVIIGDARGQVTYVSASAERILGYTPAELLGDGWWKLERGPESNIVEERAYVMRAAAGAIPADGKPYEHKIRRKDSEWCWLVIEDAKGPADLLIGVGTDITERKRAEQAVRASEAR